MWITPSSEKPFPTLRPPHTHTQAPGARALSGCGLLNPVSVSAYALVYVCFLQRPKVPRGQGWCLYLSLDL